MAASLVEETAEGRSKVHRDCESNHNLFHSDYLPSVCWATCKCENTSLLRFVLTFGSLFGIIGAMVNAARRSIVLSISMLHLALVLASSASSVTCVGSDGLVKIEANCEQSCVCDDQTTVATGLAASDGHQTHEHDDRGDCTHFLLSTFLRVTTSTNQFNSDGGPVSANAAEQAWSESDLADLKSQGHDWWAKPRPLMTQKKASLETSIVIC